MTGGDGGRDGDGVAHKGYDLALRVTRSQRVARWIDARALPLLGALALVGDIALGLVLVVAGPGEFASPTYDMARQVMALETWGVLLLSLAGFATLTWWVQGRGRIVGFQLLYVLGLGYWGFWAYLAALSSLGPNGVSGFVGVLSAILAAVHVVAGAGWPATSHRHREALDRADRLLRNLRG